MFDYRTNQTQRREGDDNNKPLSLAQSAESRMTKTTIDIQAFINEHPFTRYQWMILALCFITVAMDGFDTAIIGFIASDLVQEWGVEKSALGPVMSAALVGLAVGALTAGPLADRIGRKKC